MRLSPLFHRLTILFVVTLLVAGILGCEKSQEPSENAAETSAPAPLVSGVELSYLDTSVNPADDFFAYANGNWIKNTAIPEDKSRYGAFVILADKAREDVKNLVQNAAKDPQASQSGSEAQQIADFYASYMDAARANELGLAPLNPALEAIEKIENYADLTEHFATLNRLNVRTPLSFYISTDQKQPSRYSMYSYPSGLGLPDREYYLKDDEKSRELQTNYRAHISRLLALAGKQNSTEAADTIYTMEAAIAELHWPRTEMRDRDKTYNKMTRAELTAQGTHFDWPHYLNSADIESDDIIVMAPSYFVGLQELLPKYSLQNWQTYLTWHTLSAYASLLSDDFANEDFEFYGRTLRGAEAPEERWKQAINTLNDQLGDAIGKLYVAKHFSPEAKARMEELVENLRTAYHQAILDLEWMGDATKTKAIEKLNKFTPKIGYPDEWRDLSSIAIKPDDLVGNYQRAAAAHYDYEINKLGKPVNRNEWFMTPQTVNAYYNPGMNEIVFPAAILQPPFFNLAADDAINYGAIGAVIGHEMGHGFDDQGSKSDGDGLLENWWTEQDLEEFQNRTQKLVAQYSEFSVLDGLHLNGELTQGENIGDLSGLTIAHRAYLLSLDGKTPPVIDGYTGEQRFFLGWGQVWANKDRDEELRRRVMTGPHSPPEFRTNGVVRNMPEFYRAFNVKPENGMYLPEAERVKIW